MVEGIKLRIVFVIFIVTLTFGSLGRGANLPQRIIVKYKTSKPSSLRSFSIKESVQQSSVQKIITINENESLDEKIASLNEDKNIIYAVPDQVLTIASNDSFNSFTDEYFYQQWGLEDSVGGINLINNSLYQNQNEARSIVVAVVDTGVNFHPDLDGKILPGYDFISSTDFSNDGDGRDSDATDPGDWASIDSSCYYNGSTSSTWHGTHIAGIIAAKWNNGIGVVGINKNALILPVRVLGRCGGLTEAMKIAEFSQRHNRIIVPHCWKTSVSISATAHFAFNTSNCAFIEYLPPQLCVEILRKELATEGFDYIDGKILPPTKPGLGIELNKDAIKKYQVA